MIRERSPRSKVDSSPNRLDILPMMMPSDQIDVESHLRVWTALSYVEGDRNEQDGWQDRQSHELRCMVELNGK